MDSSSVRGSVAPPTDQSAFSFAHLHQREASHPQDVDRTTASVRYIVPRALRALATSVIWATNRRSEEETHTHAVTLETAAPLTPRDTVERPRRVVQPDELFAYDPDLAHAGRAADGQDRHSPSRL